LLAEQMEAQFADLPAEVPRVRLAEIPGTLSQQPDEEVSPAEVAVGELLQPGPHLGLDLNRVQASHALNAICISCYSKVMPGAPEVRPEAA
jgi:hypothetical protein